MILLVLEDRDLRPQMARLSWGRGLRLLTYPGLGPLLNLHGDDVLHGFLHVILVQLIWYIRVLLELFELFVFLFELLALQFDEVLEFGLRLRC